MVPSRVAPTRETERSYLRWIRNKTAESTLEDNSDGNPSKQHTVDVAGDADTLSLMKGEFTAIIEAAPEGGYWAICLEVPGANGQGETVEAAKESLKNAIRLIFEDRVEDARRGLPGDVIQTVVAV